MLELSGKFFFLSTYAFGVLFLDMNNQHQSSFKYYCVNHMYITIPTIFFETSHETMKLNNPANSALKLLKK